MSRSVDKNSIRLELAYTADLHEEMFEDRPVQRLETTERTGFRLNFCERETYHKNYI